MKPYLKVFFTLIVTSCAWMTSHAQDEFSTDSSEDMTMAAPDAPESDEPASSSNQIYTIRPGDTMWDICKIILDNPWYWPKLWSLNQYILNPNQIFPGNRLVFSPATDTSFPNFEVVADEGEESSEVSHQDESETVVKAERAGDSTFIVEQSKLRKGETLAVKLRSITMVSPKGFETIGKIASSVEPKESLMFGDKVYLKFFEQREVKPGDKFQVIEKVKMVYDPDHKTKKIGWMIRKKAVITISHIFPDKRWKKTVFEGTISDGDHFVKRDDEIIPFESDIKSVIPHFTDKEIDGKIVEADIEQILISNNDFVFLNLGTKDGVQPGLQLYAVRSGDGLEEEQQSDLPDVPVGRILIVDSKEKTSTAYVTTLDRPLSIGDRVRGQTE
jgi:hypothetical protein